MSGAENPPGSSVRTISAPLIRPVVSRRAEEPRSSDDRGPPFPRGPAPRARWPGRTGLPGGIPWSGSSLRAWGTASGHL